MRKFEALPEAFALRKVRWQLFVTLTFKAKVPALLRRKMLLWVYLRSLVDVQPKTHFPKLLWCARWEKAFPEGRGHFHVCLGGMAKEKGAPAFAQVAQETWRRLSGGIAVVKVYDNALDGIGYVLKAPVAIAAKAAWNAASFKMEFEEFQPTLSESLYRYFRLRR